MSPGTIFGSVLLLLAVAGIGYTVHALLAIARFARRPALYGPAEPVSLLKPLHGAEPRLGENLATFLAQDWDAPIELVAGVQRVDDPAAGVARGLPVREGRTVRCVVDATPHGANAKVSNLVNMMPAASHDMLVQSDSDMSVGPDYLRAVTGALAQPGVGAATCLYRGRGDAGFWSVMGAAGVSYGFLPSVVVSMTMGPVRACMGSTIAIRRETLEAIGGFAAFADVLADDHAIGAAVRARGETIAVPPTVLVHAATERTFGELMRHELRWAATVRDVVSIGEQLGLVFTQPVAPALLACAFVPKAGAAALAVALAMRALLWRRVDRWAGRTAPLWLLPLRDLLSSAVFVASLFVRSVDWRGQRLTMVSNGRIVRPEDFTA